MRSDDYSKLFKQLRIRNQSSLRYSDIRGPLRRRWRSDGRRFMVVKAAEGRAIQINVVLNWFEELK